MSTILAVEPDRRQAAHIASIVRHQVGAELVLADTTERALDALGARVPDLVLVPALLSPQDDAALAAALRVIAAAAHVRTLTIPVLANSRQEESRGGLLSRWRKKGDSPAALDGCDPAVFAEQITAYLHEAAAERAEMADRPQQIPAVEHTAPTPEIAAVDEPSQEQWDTAPPAVDDPVDTPMATAPIFSSERFDERAVDVPAFDLSERLGGRSAYQPPEEMFVAREPFGVDTRPPADEIAFETAALLEPDEGATSKASEDVPFVPAVIFETPAPLETAAAEAAIIHEAPPVEERPVVEVATAPAPVLPAVPRKRAPIERHAPKVVEAPVAAKPPVLVEKPAVREHAAILELMTPTPLRAWRAWPALEGVPIELPGAIIVTAAAKTDVPEWSELMASLRQDMERRRGQDQSTGSKSRPRQRKKPAVDEWGFFDPEQCGFSALLAKLDEITRT